MLSLVLLLLTVIAAICLPLFRPVYRFARRSRTGEALVGLAVLGGVWLLSTIMLAWLAAEAIYGIASFYKTIPPEAARQAGSLVTELWLRQLLRSFMPAACFTGDARVCRLADAAGTVGTSFMEPAIALAPALIAMFGALLVVRMRARREQKAV